MSANDWDAIFKESPNKTITLTFSDSSTISNSEIIQESLYLDESLCSNDNLRYGACEAGCFGIRIVNTSKSYKGLGVVVTIAVDGVQNPITLGTYKVDSDIPTNDRVYRDLVCYDVMYDIINTDVVSWWNGLTFPKTVKQLRDSLFTYLGVTQETVTLINDNYSVKGGLEAQELSCRDVLESICELNGVFGHITPSGTFSYVSLPSSDTLTLSHYVNNSGSYEDYVTDKITGIKSYSSDGNVPVTVGTDTNPYIMNDNLLFYGDEGSNTQKSAMTTLLNAIKDFQFRPFGVTTYGNPCVPIGTNIIVTTRYQTINSFIMRRNLSGIQAMKDSYNAVSEKTQPTDVNDTGTKITRTLGRVAKVEQSVDGIKTTVGNWTHQNSMSSVIDQMADEIVLKVDSNGKIVKVALSANPSTGTEFKVSADNISFIANGKIELTSNSLQINSTNFKVDASGKITATNADITGKIQSNEGKIGGWEITNEGLEGVSVYMFSGRSGQGYYVPGYIQLYNDSSQTQYIALSGDGGIGGSYGDSSFGLGAGSTLGPQLYLSEENSTLWGGQNTNVFYYSWGIVVNRYEEDNARPDFDIWLGENGTLNVSGALAVTDNLTCGNVNADDVIRSSKWDGTNTSLISALGGKVSKSGDTITGNLTQSRTNNSYYISKTNTHALTTASNNGITTEQDIGGLLSRDKNNHNLANIHTAMLTDGSIRLDLVAYNMKTDGTMVSNVLRLVIRKDGTATYAITNPSAFRSALGLGTMATRNANNAIIVSVTQKAVTLKSTLNSHDGGSYSSLFGSNFTVTIPSGYTLLGNLNATVNGHGGLGITLDGDAYTSATPGLYLFNSSNSNIPNTRGLQVRVISLFYKSS